MEQGTHTFEDPVVEYLFNLPDDKLNSFYVSRPALDNFVRLQFDPVKLYRYGLTPRKICEKLEVFLDCEFVYSLATPDFAMVDVYYKIPDSVELEDQEEYGYMVKNFLLEYELTGIIGINKIYLRKDDPVGSWGIDTEGSNLKYVLALSGVDPTRTMTNSLWETLGTFGIEAGRMMLVNQIKKIMDNSGVNIHKKFFEVLADSMTYKGKFFQANRHGMDRISVGPLSKISFEEPLKNFIVSSVKQEKDNLAGISSRIILGMNCQVGTGMVKIREKS
jgi:RNA polymerase Rpb1, domain 5